jgi:hypothetical protein
MMSGMLSYVFARLVGIPGDWPVSSKYISREVGTPTVSTSLSSVCSSTVEPAYNDVLSVVIYSRRLRHS